MAKDPIKTLQQLEQKVDRRVAKVLNRAAFKIKGRVASREFLHWRTGRRPIVVDRARPGAVPLSAVVRGASGWKWGQVHIGPAGSTTIRARDGMLAIPTDAVGKRFRSKLLGPRRYGGTVIFSGIIWGKAGWAGTSAYVSNRRAAGERMNKGTLVPLFILKQSVVVQRRIIPANLLAWIRPQLLAALKSEGIRLNG